MSDWTDGYVADVPYTPGYYRELSPLHLSVALALRGKHGPDISARLNYCELGMGYGVSLLAHAAAFPHMHFWGCDFNPAHVASASHFAKAAGLDNVTLTDDSFEALLERDLPKMDFICLHGVLSWISATNRQRIIEFIDGHLNPGGVVLVSYNALPGWAAAQPLRELMQLHAQRTHGAGAPLSRRIRDAVQFAGSCVAHTEARYFKTAPGIEGRMRKLEESSVNYLAHEYFNADWQPFYAHEVAALLAPARLEFVGPAGYLELVDAALLPAEALKFLEQQDDPILRETLKDYFLNTQFRRDIYVRGPALPTPVWHVETLQRLRWALAVPPDQIKWTLQGLNGEITLRQDAHEPMVQLLASGPKTVAELHAAVPGLPFKAVLQALVLLAGGGYLLSCLPPDAVATDAVTRYNRHAAAHAGESTTGFLASALAGVALPRGQVTMLFLGAHLRGVETPPAMARSAWAVLQRQGQFLQHEGKRIETAQENIEHLTRLAEQFISEDLAKLQALHPF